MELTKVKTYYTTLGTSVINIPVSPPSLPYSTIVLLIDIKQQTNFIINLELHNAACLFIYQLA